MISNVLLIDDETVFAENVGAFLSRAGHKVRIASSGDSGMRAYEKARPDIVLLDYQLGEADGLNILSDLGTRDTAPPIVFMTGYGNVELAVQAMKLGACDFLTKPVALERIRDTVDRVVGKQSTSQRFQRDDPQPAQIDLLGASKPMARLKERIAQIASARDAILGAMPPSVLIHGETGTGKELVARALHNQGPRRDGPFISINCAAIPAHLLEAELFGHERGAFTDAKTAKVGLIEAADGGVLFLDEIGDLDLSIQAKLLRALDQRIIRRIGSVKDRAIDVWIVSATNRDLRALVDQQAFRSDLLYRLNVLTIETPPLRERGSDIAMLAETFLNLVAQRSRGSEYSFSSAALEKLSAHKWPGNVRELRNVVEEAALFCRNRTVQSDDCRLEKAEPMGAGSLASLGADGIDLAELEHSLIIQALERASGNVSAAAPLLGLSRDALRYRMKKRGLRCD